MPPDPHPSAPRLSRTRLHLFSFGIAGVLITALFGLASILFLSDGKETVTGSRAANGAVATESASYPDTPALSGNTVPATGEASSPKADAAKPAPVLPEGSPHSPQPPAKSEIEPAPATLPADRDGSAITTETRPASAPGNQPTEETQPLETGQPAAQPQPSGIDLGPSQATTAKTTAVIPDYQRDDIFHSLQMQQQKVISRGAISQPRPPREQAVQAGRNGRPDNATLGHDAAFRSRVRKECGPIKDRALYRSCVASFGTYHR